MMPGLPGLKNRNTFNTEKRPDPVLRLLERSVLALKRQKSALRKKQNPPHTNFYS
jgi:hypothetical protein